MLHARLGLALAATALVGGCAAWSDHNETTKDARVSFEQGRFDEALKALEPEVNNKLDGLCFQLDRGVIAQVGGKYQLSAKELERAENTIEQFEDRGLTGGKIAEEIGSFAVNEKTIPYEGEAFEKVLVPVFGTRNYLLEGQFEDAMVEVRKVWFQQDLVRKLKEKEIDESNKKADEEKIDRSKLGDVERQVTYPPDVLKSPESVYEITYAHYLTALIAERMQNWNDAYISMKSVAKIRGDVDFVRTDLMRYAKAMGMDDDLRDYKQKWPETKLPGKDMGSVTLLFDCGWAPHKRELKFAVPGYRTIGAVAIPLYEKTPNPATSARLVIGDRRSQTRVISDVNAIAFKYHRDRLPVMVLKQIIRTTLKTAAASAAAAGTEAGVGGQEGQLAAGLVGLAGGIYNYASEQADLRAWLTLPETFQASRAWMPAGTYDVKVELCGPGGNVLNTIQLGKITVKPGSQRFVAARSLGRSFYGHLLKETADRGPAPGKKAPATATEDLRKPDEPARKAPPVEKTRTEDLRKPDEPNAGDAPPATEKTETPPMDGGDKPPVDGGDKPRSEGAGGE